MIRKSRRFYSGSYYDPVQSIVRKLGNPPGWRWNPMDDAFIWEYTQEYKDAYAKAKRDFIFQQETEHELALMAQYRLEREQHQDARIQSDLLEDYWNDYYDQERRAEQDYDALEEFYEQASRSSYHF